MSKRPHTGQEHIDAIALAFADHPDYSARKIRDEARLLLVRKKRAQILDPDRWISISKVSKVIRSINSTVVEDKRQLDSRWEVSSLVKHAISPSGLPAVLRIAMRVREEGTWLSVRQALWVDRLHDLFDRDDLLLFYACEYALQERLFDLLGKKSEELSVDDPDRELYFAFTRPEELSEIYGFGSTDAKVDPEPGA